MRDDTGTPASYGFRAGCAALLCMMTAGGFGPAEASLGPAALAPHRPEALTMPAAQLDFGARDVQYEPGVEVPLSLRLPSPDQLRRAGSETGAFILIRNIPEGLTFSEGMPIGTNWIMSLPQSGRARLMAKRGASGSHRLEFLLIGPGNRVLAESSVVARAAQPKAPPPSAAETPVAAIGGGVEPEKRPAAPPTRAAPSINREEEAILLAKGAELIGQGGIAGARLIFEELAQQGSSQGALALARTYDPAYIAAAPAGSITPSIPEALKWYERAADLGSGEATQRISQLAPQR